MTFKELRKHRGMTQEQLAAASGVDWATISTIETGRSKDPRSGNVEALARGLNVTMEELMNALAETKAEAAA